MIHILLIEIIHTNPRTWQNHGSIRSMSTLEELAVKVLDKNWLDGYSIPTKSLYPFQWHWDSGFTSLGNAHSKLERSIEELRSLFSGQWDNGMIPHIVFHSENEDSYFPNFDFWNANVNAGAPSKPKTSGITQPAVHGFILEKLIEISPDDPELISFIKYIFPSIVNYHRFLYNFRDPYKEGLMFIYHPWESGRDNSPLWDEAMDRIDLDLNAIPNYIRKDTSIADSSERPTNDQYDRYVYLLELGKKHKYDGNGIFEESEFLIQDTLMNAVLIRSNDSLIKLAERFGFDSAELKEWNTQSIRTFNEKLWDPELKTYAPFDMRSNSRISYKEIGSFVSLFASIPSDNKAKILNDYLLGLHEAGFYLCPSFDPYDSLFDSKRYWRGPIWPQMNWMIYHGLKNYSFMDTADIVKNDLLYLVSKHGFHEYFESQKSIADMMTHGYGGSDFSWTAACTLDLIKHS